MVKQVRIKGARNFPIFLVRVRPVLIQCTIAIFWIEDKKLAQKLHCLKSFFRIFPSFSMLLVNCCNVTMSGYVSFSDLMYMPQHNTIMHAFV